MLAVGPAYGFGLYVHWPYCARICPYCDFNVYAAKDRETGALVTAICNDIRAHKRRLPDHPALDSVFLGGGTPSLLRPAETAEILDAANQSFGLKPGAEITLEANPNDSLRSDLAAWAAAGVNRVSLGIQSLNDRALTFLGRDHNAADALKAVEQVQARFDNHSLDLIYARPGQSVTNWQAELKAVLALGAPHLSLYELTIEARTAFGHRASRGELVPMAEDDQADLYEATQALCSAANLPAYEVSNHASAKPYEAVHNHIYWNSGDWIGVGPGAHGRITRGPQRYATEAARRPKDYIAASAPAQTALSKQEIALELLAMGLRPSTGLDISRFETLTPAPLSAETIASLIASQHLTQIGKRIALTPSGRLLADRISAELAP